MLVDTHAHLDLYPDERLEGIVRDAVAMDVATILTIGDAVASSRRAVEIAERFTEVYATVGVHPHDAASYDDAAEDALRELIGHSERVVAVGEVGLDFYRMRASKEIQMAAFRRQAILAREFGLPLVVHDRDAHDETLAILRDVALPADRVVLHCFSGDPELAASLIDLGAYISLAGPVTFLNAPHAHELARTVPLERLLIETDAPYLAPHPFRGRENQPAYVALVARRIADLRGVEPAEIADVTTTNACRVFGFAGAG